MLKYFPLVFALISAIFVYFHFRDASLHGDSGLFAGMATHLLHGKILYRDVWDNKPPGIFLLYAFFQWIGKNIPEIFHIIQAFVAGLMSYLILRNYRNIFSGQVILAIICLPVILFSYMNWPYYLNGFFIEEFGILFYLISGVLLTGRKRTNARLVAAGMFAAAAILCKEPFVFLFIGTLVFIGIISEKKIRSILIFGCGAMIPVLFIFIYLLSFGIFRDYLHYLSFAFGYSGIGGNARPGWWQGIVQYHNYMKDLMPYYHLFFWAGAGSLFDREFGKKSRETSWLWFILFIVSSGIPALGMVQYGHYFIPMAFFGALFTMNGILWITGKIYNLLQQKFNAYFRFVPYILLSIYLLYFNTRSYRFLLREKYTQTISEKDERREVLRVSADAKELYVDMEFYGYYYFFTGKVSQMPFPTPMLGYFDESAGKALAVENREKFSKKFTEHPPDGMITGKKFSAAIIYSGMEEFALQHYELRDSFETCTGAKAWFWSLKKTD